MEAGSILGTLWIEGKVWFSSSLYSSSFKIDNEILAVLVGWSAVWAEICSPGARKQAVGDNCLGDSSRKDPVGGCALVMLRLNGGCRQDC